MKNESLLLLSKYDEEIQLLAENAGKLITSSIKGILEFPDTSANMVAFGFANTYKDMICTIILSKKEIKIGFNKGAELPDPDKLLMGTGKVHKYVQIKSQADLQNKALKKLLSEGLKAWKMRIQ